jgi:outer membrane murein-binding lipoprotein Lpp
MRKRFRVLAAVTAVTFLATGLLAACGDDAAEAERDELRQQVDQLRMQTEQLQTELAVAQASAQALLEPLAERRDVGEEPMIKVIPEIWAFPERRLRTAGDVWFVGSGLEPGQWYRITVHHDGGLGEMMDFAEDRVRMANEEGAFAVGTPFVRPGRFFGVPVDWEDPGGVWVVKLWDMDTDELLASTPWVVCGSARENEWCEAAEPTALVPSDDEEE